MVRALEKFFFPIYFPFESNDESWEKKNAIDLFFSWISILSTVEIDVGTSFLLNYRFLQCFHIRFESQWQQQMP